MVNKNSQFAIQTAAPSHTAAPTVWGKLFLDALCIDVNSSNAISNVTPTAIQDIFESGAPYLTWNQVPAASGAASSLGSQTILEEGRNSAAGQFTFFTSTILKAGRRTLG